jgi:hypothetical protein
MLTVTLAALDRLSQKLTSGKTPEDLAMRFTRGNGGWRLRQDRRRPADTAFTYKGRAVLVLDDSVSQAMTDMTLDVRDTEAGPRLSLR